VRKSDRLKDAGVWVRSKKKCKVTANSDHKQPVFDNLLKREFDVDQTDHCYISCKCLLLAMFMKLIVEITY